MKQILKNTFEKVLGLLKKISIKKLFIFLSVFAVIIALYLVGTNLFIKLSVKKSILQDPAEEYDCILVLGAGVNGDRPSHMLQDRLDVAIDLYEKNVSSKLLMTGDHGRKNYDEVNVMKQYAIDQGIPSENVFMDHAGFSTYESIYRARDVFKAEKILIVTQEYHLYRALYIAKSLGLDADGVPSDPRQYVGQSYREFREMLARSKDFLFCIVKPLPKYLGDAIPVSGNGDLTNDR